MLEQGPRVMGFARVGVNVHLELVAICPSQHLSAMFIFARRRGVR